MKTLTGSLVMCYYFRLLYVMGDMAANQQFDYRRMPGETATNTLPYLNTNFPPRPNQMSRQQIFYTNAMNPQPSVPTPEKVQPPNSSFPYHEFLNAMREFTGDFGASEEENQKLRASNVINDKQPDHLPHDIPRQNFDPWPQSLQESASSFAPIKIRQPAIKALPKFNFLEPVTTKISGKLSGLMSFILALLGSGSDNFFTKGFKEVLINGIIKPLLVVKGGLKVIISKLSIPVLSLILINLEILITVWWLWDDCPLLPIPVPHVYTPYEPAQSAPAADNYGYNTTYR